MPIHSMTGFGEARAEEGGVTLSVEMKSVNHRFLDIVWRLPSGYARFENELAKLVRASVARGRIEVSVSRAETKEPAYEVRFNQELFDSYLNSVKAALQHAAITDAQSLSAATLQIVNKREVLELAAIETSTEAEYGLLERTLKEALARLVQMRDAEGAELEKEVRSHLSSLEATMKAVQKKSESTPIDFKARLTARLERTSPGVELDPQRLMQEVALLADRIDVTEELARLNSHFLQFKKVLDEAQGGRKLEFLLQEFGREINTIGSKAQNSEITTLVVDAKATVEKLREQVANIE